MLKATEMSDAVVDWTQDTGAPSASGHQGERRVSHKKLNFDAYVKSPVLHTSKGLISDARWAAATMTRWGEASTSISSLLPPRLVCFLIEARSTGEQQVLSDDDHGPGAIKENDEIEASYSIT